MEWNEKLRLLKANLNESNVDLAKILGVDDTTVGRWLNGENEPSRQYMEIMVKHYGVSWDELFNPEVELPAKIRDRDLKRSVHEKWRRDPSKPQVDRADQRKKATGERAG